MMGYYGACMMGYYYACNGLLWYMGHTSKWQIYTGDDHFLTAAGYCRK